VLAALLAGLLHGIWHLPIILLTPFYHGEGNHWIVIPLFLLTLTAGGVFYSYLRLTSNSLWPVALGHGAFNTFWSMFTALAVPTSPLWMEYLSGESGVITLILAVVAVGFLVQRLQVQTPQPALRTTMAQPVTVN
jgi:CAAX protease family protein